MSDPSHGDRPDADHEHLLIAEPGDGQSWWAFTAWLLCYFGVAAALVVVFVRFTASVAWAIGLVVFMLGYMTIMARWASGNADRRE
jgi:hypothetical protein